MASTEPLPKRAAWKALQAHHEKVLGLHLRTLFAEDPKRGERMTVDAAGIYFDYSKNRVTDETVKLLLQLAEQSGLRARVDAMFRGDKINVSEQRAVLHVALRAPKGASMVVDGENVVPHVHAVLDKMSEFADRVRSGAWKGHTAKRIRNVINIGIGGSDLGPVMAYEALKHYSERNMTFRVVGDHVVGVLVLSNFGLTERFVLCGRPVGVELARETASSGEGSCICLVATDAPLLPHQLRRLARRPFIGLGRTGSYGSHGSGEIAFAWTTANLLEREAPAETSLHMLSDELLSVLFAACAEAAEEAVLNALCAGRELRGYTGRVLPRFPAERFAMPAGA